MEGGKKIHTKVFSSVLSAHMHDVHVSNQMITSMNLIQRTVLCYLSSMLERRISQGLLWLYHCARIGLAVLFIYGGVIKLFDPRAFARTISGYDLVPELFLPVAAVGLPIIETLAGVGLLLDIRGALAVIAGLLGMFILVLGYGISQHLSVDCGCFGAEDLARQDGLMKAFWRDVFLGGLVVPYLYYFRWVRAKKANQCPGREPSATDSVRVLQDNEK